MCNKIVKNSNRTTVLNKDWLISLIQQYCEKKVRMQHLISKIKRSRRQITRMVKSYRTTGKISTTRGYGSHLPYNPKDAKRVFMMLYENVNEKLIAHKMEVPIKRLKNHIKIISLPRSNYSLEWDGNRENCTFMIYIDTFYLMHSVLRISITINVKKIEIIDRKAEIVEKRNISLTHQNCEYYNQFVDWFIEVISETYFQQIKMRTMGRKSELEREKTFKSYYSDIIKNMESSDLLERILKIIYYNQSDNHLYFEIDENERKLSMLNITV